jgi:hypothetical protein
MSGAPLAEARAPEQLDRILHLKLRQGSQSPREAFAYYHNVSICHMVSEER